MTYEGSGKTLLALTAAHRLDQRLGEKLRIKIVVPSGTLLRQWDKALRGFLAELKDGENVLLIADECHRYGSEQNRLIFEFLSYIKGYETSFFSLGLSATLPAGAAGKYLSEVLGGQIYDYRMEKTLAACTVCPYDIFHISLAFTGDERAEYTEFSDRISILFGRLAQTYPGLRDMGRKELFESMRVLCKSRDGELADMAAGYLGLAWAGVSGVGAVRLCC